VLALAGFTFAPEARAQSRPYASTGSYDDVGPGNQSVDTVGTAGTTDYQSSNDMSVKSIQPYGISPDETYRDQPPTDMTTDERARELTDRQRASDQNAEQYRRRAGSFDRDGNDGRRSWIIPYIEADQVVESRIASGSDTFTYSVVSVGVDGGISGANNQGQLSLRYERRIGYGKSRGGGGDDVEGIGRATIGIVPDVLHFDVAGYASKTRIDGTGATINNVNYSGDQLAQIYSVYGGPSLHTESGDLVIDGHYRVGYSHVGSPATPTAVVAGQADIFDHSVVQDASGRVGLRPGDTLPIGVAVEGGHYREDISNLDQKARDSHVRGEVLIPVADHTALVGGIGYEDVTVTAHDAVRDANGNPVYSSSGRLETNYASPALVAFDTSGLIWDAGVLWKPSPRTNLEAHVGRRYGEFGGYGLFTYHPTSRTSFNVAVYHNMAGFGGQLTNSLFNLPTQFQAIRDGLTGNVSTCVSGQSGGSCLNGALATVRSTVYRSRGVSATYNVDLGHVQTGLGLGYDRREYFTPQGTVVAQLNGEVDQYYWVAGYVSGELNQREMVSATLNAFWFKSDVVANDNLSSVQATAIYQYLLSRHLTASASVGLDEVSRDNQGAAWDATGAVGMRYSF
jgi:hypothetical protein